MSKNRMINTRFWNDSFVVDHLNPLDRYLYLYLLTNDKTNISGIFELPIRVIANETGLDKEEITKMLKRLEPKVHYRDGWIVIANMIKHQNYKNSKIATGLQRELCNAPAELIELVKFPNDFNMDFSCPVDKKSMTHDDSSMTHDVPNTILPNTILSKPTVTKPNAKSESVENSNDDNRTTGLNKLEGRKYSDITMLYDDLEKQGLVNGKFKSWYCQQFFKIGRERVQRFASEAKADGKDPQKLFSHLIQKESGTRVGAK